MGLAAAASYLLFLAVVVLTWIAMLAWSKAWLAGFRYGPLEWLWRCLTYLEPPPMRRAAPVAAPSHAPAS